MITLKLQITVFLAAILLLFFVIRGIRSGKLQLKHALLWLFLGLINMVFALSPGAALFLTQLMGIELPVNAMFLTSIVVAYLLILQLSINGSTNELKKRKIAQKLTILEEEVRELKQQVEELSKNKL
ncbi:MAG: DUF2304 domain-containing protein [Xanthomonadales bacterium]|nr:DUF2304 domain-containing protein [Xanthomonadales bacterium]